jgi:PIN domain nuclease of toxin-antitoxin system
MASVVADTHVIVWYLSDTSRLSTESLAALDGAIESNHPIYLSAISLVEIIYLVEKRRLPTEILTRILTALDERNFGLVLISLERNVAEKLREIDKAIVPEMPDRIIAATALYLDIPLVTRDLKIQNLSVIQTIW